MCSPLALLGDVRDEDSPRVSAAFGVIGNSSLVVLVLTIVAFAGGIAFRNTYYLHWLLPAGEPPWDATESLSRGALISIPMSAGFLFWLSAADDAVEMPFGATRMKEQLRRTSWLVPASFYGFFVGIVVYEILDAMLQSRLSFVKFSSWAVFVLLVAAIVPCIYATIWFTKAYARRDSLREFSRGQAAIIFSAVTVGLLLLTFAYGTFQGEQDGRVDASGDHSTLMRVSFKFRDASLHEQQDWRLLAHTSGTYYVFDFKAQHQSKGQPIVYLIPDGAVEEASITGP